jgi:hypothetical protein
MPSTIANDIQGIHPHFLGVDEPQGFSASTKWSVLAENNPRKAILQAKFAEGQVLTMRVDTSKAPVTEGSRSTFPFSDTGSARWVAYREHVKLLVDFTGAPATRTLTVDYTASGVSLLVDSKGGLDILAGAQKVGALPRPWLEYLPDGSENRTRVWLDWSLGVGSFSVTMPELSATEWQGALLDPTVITTSTASTATAYSNQRKIDRTSNGVVWAMFWDGTSTTGTSMDFYYSTDDGATWTKGGEFGFAGTGTTYTPNGSFFIDLDDFAHVVYKDRHNGYIYYRRGTPNAARTAWTWSSAVTVHSTTEANYPDVVAHREGTGWKAHVVWSRVNTNNFSLYAPITIDSSGTITLGTLASIGGGYSNTNHVWPSIDFNHTGDGKTVAGGTPHLYVAWSAGATGSGKGIRFKKATYSGGSWTWGTEREIDSTRYIWTNYYWLNCLFDGTSVIITGQLYDDAERDLLLYERDAADTATTARELAANTGDAGGWFRGSSSYDSNRNVYFLGAKYVSGLKDLRWAKWDRASASFGAVTVIDASPGEAYASVKRGYSGNKIEFIYTDGTASPYSVTYDSISLGTSLAILPAAETDEARPLTRVKKRLLGRAIETDTAQAFGKIKLKTLGPAFESDFANSISKGYRVAVAWATEDDFAVPVGIVYTDVFYAFSPPVRWERIPTHQKPFKYYRRPVSMSVVYRDSHFQEVRVTNSDETENLEEGTTWFPGGRSHPVNQDTKALLEADGFTEFERV